MKKPTRILTILALLACVLAVFYSFREQPILVDSQTLRRGGLKVELVEEGVVQVRDLYVISAPVIGTMKRIDLKEGEWVIKGETVLARFSAPEPPFIDQRSVKELIARVAAAESAVALARLEHKRALTSHKLAKSEKERAEKLALSRAVSERDLELKQNEYELSAATLISTNATIELRKAERESAKAGLSQPGDISKDEACCINVIAPADGKVLSIPEQSETLVVSGTPVMSIGDPRSTEIKVDLLSADAVKVKLGANAYLSHWGEEKRIKAKVRKIESTAFTHLSSLGLEEQRVNVLLNAEEVPEGLGHGYRVLVHIELWASDDELLLPISALFRSEGEWATFIVENESAVLRVVELGELNNEFAQVLSGVSEGEQVIIYPNDLLEDGTMVSPR